MNCDSLATANRCSDATPNLAVGNRLAYAHTTMKPNARAIPRGRPNRILVALAAAWMVLSLAIGGAVNADSSAQAELAPAVAESTQD